MEVWFMAYKKIDYIQENKRLWFHKGAFLRKIKVNRKYKDRLFRHLFMNKTDLLELYNSLADKEYTNTDELIIITLKDAIFMKMKNDISFILAKQRAKRTCLHVHLATAARSNTLPLGVDLLERS